MKKISLLIILIFLVTVNNAQEKNGTVYNQHSAIETTRKLWPAFEKVDYNRQEISKRLLRKEYSSDGRILFPFMEYQEMSDEDISAIISFLRSQEPVRNEIKPTEYGFLGKALIAFGLFKAKGPENTPPVSVAPDSTIVYEKYLAHDVGNCRSCHSKIDNSGKQVGADFAGGFSFAPTEWSQGHAFVSANLTPHKTSGALKNWTEERFIDRYRTGRVYERSPMPWGCYSRMSESDLKALFRYLQSLEPVDFAVAKTVYKPVEELPKN